MPVAERLRGGGKTDAVTIRTASRQDAGQWSRRVAPGLALAAGGAATGYAVHAWAPGVQPGTVAVALGALLVNLRLVPSAAGPGLTFAAKKLLRVAVVLLGFSLSLEQVIELGGPGLGVVLVTVAAAFFGTLALARLLRVRASTGLLVATGFSICGASAVAAMEPLAKGKKDDTAVSIALVTLCGSLAIVVLPLLRDPLGLQDPVAFGQWVGASVHDVGQVVATANTAPGSLESAVIVKLSRVMLLAPLVFGVGIYLHRRRADSEVSGKRPALVPLFVAGFIAVIAVNSAVELPAGLSEAARTAQEILLTGALFALGTGIHWQVMRRAGGRPLVLGLLSWLLIGAVSYAGVTVIR